MKKWFPLVILVVLMVGAYLVGVWDYLSFEALKVHRDKLQVLVADHYLLMPLLYIGLYIAVAALSIPVGLFLSIAGGFLFPQPLCTLYVVVGATIGASILFLIARTAFGDVLRRRAGAKFKKVEGHFREHGVGYLLFLRFVPIFPFWLVNIAPAFFGVSLKVFVFTTFVGVIPGAIVFTQAGRGLSAVFDSGEAFTIQSVLNWEMIIALGLLAVVYILVGLIRRRYD